MVAIGRIGVWSGALRYGDATQAKETAAALEELGFGAVWLPDVGGDLFDRVAEIVGGTRTLQVASGILNIWMHTAEETAKRHEEIGPRFLVGLGVSHSMLIDAQEPGTYRRPLAKMREYLDALDAASPPLAREDRVLAALGPKMLELARERSGGAHPYLVGPDHTAFARSVLGAGPLLAPEQAAVLATDAAEARQVARGYLTTYLMLPNYTNNLRRFGYGDEDFAGGGSDRLVDAIVVWGDEGTIAARVQAHWDAGADHVCVQLLGDDGIDAWRRLAPALL